MDIFIMFFLKKKKKYWEKNNINSSTYYIYYYSCTRICIFLKNSIFLFILHNSYNNGDTISLPYLLLQ